MYLGAYFQGQEGREREGREGRERKRRRDIYHLQIN